MPGRFGILTDENIDGPVTQGLKAQGWDVGLIIDVFGEESDDDVIFQMVYWHQGRHQRVRAGRFVEAFEELAQNDHAFAACLEYLQIPA